MPSPAETITTDTASPHCDGGPSGHPRVFLTMKNGRVDCPYCGKHFVLSENAPAEAH